MSRAGALRPPCVPAPPRPPLRRRFLVGCLLLLALLACPAVDAWAKVLFQVGSGARLSLAELVQELRTIRVVVFGERHDSPDDHVAQRTLLQALHDGGVRMSLGLEMFRADAQPDLDRWIAGDMTEKEFAALFSSNWTAALYPYYRDLLLYARQEKIPLVGLNLPQSVVSRVSRSGPQALSDEERGQLGLVACDVDEKYKKVLSQALGPREAPPEKFEKFCQAQVVWDVAMAKNAVEYSRRHPERQLLVLAGNYHAWKLGIPEQISRLSRLSVKVVLPSNDGAFPRYNYLTQEADYIWSIE